MADDNAQAQAASAQQYDWRPRPDPTDLTTQQLRETETALNRTISERIAGLRELIEQRLDGMDRATVLLAERLDGMPADAVHGRDNLRTEFAAAIKSLRELIEARLDASDTATRLLADSVGKVPTETEKATMQLRELLGERIDGMDVATKLLAENVGQVPSGIDRGLRAIREILEGQIRQVESVAMEKFTAIEGTFASNALALAAALAAQKEAAAETNKSNTLAIDRANSATKETIAANAAQTTNSLGSQAATIDDIKQRVVRIESGGLAATAVRGEARDTGAEQRAIEAEKRAVAAEVLARTAAQRNNITIAIAAVAVLVSIILPLLLH